MIRAVFSLAAVWEIARFAVLFFLISAGFEDESQYFGSTTLWFGSAQLGLAAAFLFGAIKPERLRDVALNIVRTGKILATISGGIAVFTRMYQAILDGTADGPVEWVRDVPVVLLLLAIDFILALFLLSYTPSRDTDTDTKQHLPDYDVTDLEEDA